MCEWVYKDRGVPPAHGAVEGLPSFCARAVRVSVSLLCSGQLGNCLLLAWPCLRGKMGWVVKAQQQLILYDCSWYSNLVENALVHASVAVLRVPGSPAKALAQVLMSDTAFCVIQNICESVE